MSIATLLPLLLQLAPQLIPLGKDLVGLFKAHPQLKPEEILAFITLVHSADDATRALILADIAANPTV